MLIHRMLTGAWGAIVLLGACAAAEQGVVVGDAVYRPPLGASGVGVAYATITSPRDDIIVGVSSPAAEAVEIHETIISGAASRMQRVDRLPLAAGEAAVFSPGGRHLMVIGPKGPPLTEGSAATFPIQFQFESGITVVVGFRAEVTKP